MSGRILLVDDNENMRETAKDILEDAGYQVVTSATVAGAYALLQAAPFDSMIVDLNLPDGSGLELAEKARGRMPGLRILLLTGQAEGAAPLGLSARQNGTVDEFLVKPVSPPHLLYLLKRTLG